MCELVVDQIFFIPFHFSWNSSATVMITIFRDSSFFFFSHPCHDNQRHGLYYLQSHHILKHALIITFSFGLYTFCLNTIFFFLLPKFTGSSIFAFMNREYNLKSKNMMKSLILEDVQMIVVIKNRKLNF